MPHGASGISSLSFHNLSITTVSNSFLAILLTVVFRRPYISGHVSKTPWLGADLAMSCPGFNTSLVYRPPKQHGSLFDAGLLSGSIYDVPDVLIANGLRKSSNILHIAIVPFDNQTSLVGCILHFQASRFVSFDGTQIDDFMINSVISRRRRVTVVSASNASTLDTVRESVVCSSARVQKTVFIEQSVTLLTTALADPISGAVTGEMSSTVSKGAVKDTSDQPTELEHAAKAGDGAIIEAVSMAVANNVSSLLTDALTYSINARLTKVIPFQLGTTLSESLYQTLRDPVFENLYSGLLVSIPSKESYISAPALGSTLSTVLIEHLGLTLTQTLVPSLSLSLGHTVDTAIYCRNCQDGSSGACGSCQYSASHIHYLNYISAYYSDYFQSYYSNYYSQAFQNLMTTDNAS